MLQCDEDWLSVVDGFSAAALGSGSWLDALSGLAHATGSRAGELIGLGSEKSVPFNWVTDLGPDWLEEFIAIGGGDPAINPFVHHGTRISPLTVLASSDFITRDERRTNPFLVEHAHRHDIPYVCLTPLLKENGMLVGLAVLRSARQGEVDNRQRNIFATLAPHARAAVRTQMALENQGAQLVAGAMESLSLAVFVCDRLGTVRSMTPTAEALVSAGTILRLGNGLLASTNPSETDVLNNAIGLAASGLHRPGAPLSSTVLIERPQTAPLILEIMPLPRREFAFGYEPRALVIVRGMASDPTRLKGLLQGAYGLTLAEVDVALRLGEGQPPEVIATTRGAAIGTVRVQIRTIYAKLGVHHLSGLTARINQLR